MMNNRSRENHPEEITAHQDVLYIGDIDEVALCPSSIVSVAVLAPPEAAVLTYGGDDDEVVNVADAEIAKDHAEEDTKLSADDCEDEPTNPPVMMCEHQRRMTISYSFIPATVLILGFSLGFGRNKTEISNEALPITSASSRTIMPSIKPQTPPSVTSMPTKQITMPTLPSPMLKPTAKPFLWKVAEPTCEPSRPAAPSKTNNATVQQPLLRTSTPSIASNSDNKPSTAPSPSSLMRNIPTPSPSSKINNTAADSPSSSAQQNISSSYSSSLQDFINMTFAHHQPSSTAPSPSAAKLPSSSPTVVPKSLPTAHPPTTTQPSVEPSFLPISMVPSAITTRPVKPTAAPTSEPNQPPVAITIRPTSSPTVHTSPTPTMTQTTAMPTVSPTMLTYSGGPFANDAELRESVRLYFSGTAQGPPISEWNVSGISDFSDLFQGDGWFSPLRDFNDDVSMWDMSSATTTSGMFQLTSFNQPLYSWNTANVQDMSSMFFSAPSFDQDISLWNVENVQTMEYMFGASMNIYESSFNQNLSPWSTSSLTNIENMFLGAAFNGDLSNLDVSRVTTMEGTFYGANKFQQDLSAWDTASVTNMYSMFGGTASFDQDISMWNTGSVTNMGSMFHEALNFNQDISTWDVSKVQDFSYMFSGAAAFNQDLCAWGPKAPNSANVRDMFCPISFPNNYNNSCPLKQDPDFSLDPPGPFCYSCS